MQRPVSEVLASQDKMLRRRGNLDAVSRVAMEKAFRDHGFVVDAWLKTRPDISVHWQLYGDLIQSPNAACEGVRELLGLEFDLDWMTAEVDPALYRNRHR